MEYLNIALLIINFLLFIINLFIIIKFCLDNKKIISINNKEKDYIEKINYYKKINIKDTFNILIVFLLYLVLIAMDVVYINIIFIVIGMFLIINTNTKINKFKILSDKLYKNISILKRKPGIAYYFDFHKDILNTKNMFILGIILILTTLTSYLFSRGLNSMFALNLFLAYIYVLLKDKKTLIEACSSSFIELLDKKQYTKLNKITSRNIIVKSVFEFKYYHIVVDNKCLSPLLIYDPEMYLEDIEVYINREDGKGIILISKLYE